MEHQNAVKEALNALYHHPDDTVRVHADRWLQNFQGTLDAWQVADNLLHDSSSNLETLIFCSQTLRSKVQRDFEELPPGAFQKLRQSLTTLLKKFHKGPPKVRTQISIAVAALAVHVPAADWGDGGIISWLRDEMHMHPEYVPGFLELLTVLPEETFNYKIAARPDRRRQFEKELTSQMEAALSILSACLKISELKEQVLEAFASWLRLRHGIPGTVLACHPLVHAALSSLNCDPLSEASVNVISELIHHTASPSSGGISAQTPLIQVIVPQILSLQAHLRDSSKDEEDVKAIGRLFADVGDSYVELIATGSDEPMVIVHALLEVTAHPEFDIASMTFNFWHSLQLMLTKRESYSSLGSEASIEVERNRRLHIFQPAYQSLVSLVGFRVQYPEDYQGLSYEDLKEFKQTRYAVADVLIDAALILGGDTTLKILYMKLLEANAQTGNNFQDWRPAEAILFCIWAISNYVSVVEAEVMPQVMALLQNLPQQAQLLQTACLLVGAYSKWLNAAPASVSILPSIIRILMSGMGTSEDCAAAAALAFRHTCDDCRKNLCGYFEDLFNIYCMAINGGGGYKVSAEDSLNLVEALGMVVTELPLDQAKGALEKLCFSAASPLEEAAKEDLEKKHARELTVHIDRFAFLFRYVNHPEAVAAEINKHWAIFRVIFDARPWDMRTMESLCRACKYAVRTSGRYIIDTIGEMLEKIQFHYQQHHQPCFLYLSSEVIKIFGSDPSCAVYLKNLIETLFAHTTCLMTSIKEVTARPDIADDCFLLASRCLRYCPHLFIPSPIFPALVNCAMIGITVQHREACHSILTFLTDIFDLEKSVNEEQFVRIRDNIIIPRGATITRILIASLAGALPSSRLDTVTYSLLALTRTYRLQAVSWAKESVSLIPRTALTETESTKFLQALSDIAYGADVNSLIGQVEELSDVCRLTSAPQPASPFTPVKPVEEAVPSTVPQASSASSGQPESTFLGYSAFTWSKIIPLGLMFFCILFNYTILRDTKDVLVVTAPGSGAEIIPFLKTWVNLPMAIAFTVGYAKLANVLSSEALFYTCIIPFILFFGSFAAIMYPLRDALHPTAYCEKLLADVGVRFAGPIAILRNWTYCLFYVMAELWGSVVVSVLFWGFANQITTVEEAEGFYPLFGLGANVALIFSGQAVKYFSEVRANLPPGVDGWGVSLNGMMGMVVIGGLIITGIYYALQRNVVPKLPALREKKKKVKAKMSVGESFAFLAASPYIRDLATLVVAYGISINLVEVTWKSKIKAQFPNPNDYSAFMGNFSTATGIVTFTMMILAKQIFSKFGWGVAALITPTVLLITGLIFFALVLAGQSFAPTLAQFGLTPLYAAVLVGAAQNIFSKSSKYSLFDPCKEMAYIPLEDEVKTKGKAAIDVICNPLGKSGGALIQQFMIIGFGSLAASTPYLGVILLGIVLLWIRAAASLNVQFVAQKKLADQERRDFEAGN